MEAPIGKGHGDCVHQGQRRAVSREVAKQAGASQDEVISALLEGLPAAGHGITQSLPAAIESYEAE
jgi:hypothetical protein